MPPPPPPPPEIAPPGPPPNRPPRPPPPSPLPKPPLQSPPRGPLAHFYWGGEGGGRVQKRGDTPPCAKNTLLCFHLREGWGGNPTLIGEQDINFIVGGVFFVSHLFPSLNERYSFTWSCFFVSHLLF